MLPALVRWCSDDGTSTICIGLAHPGDDASDATRIDGKKFPGDSACVSPFHVTPAYADLITKAKLLEEHKVKGKALPRGTMIQILNTTVVHEEGEMKLVAKCRCQQGPEFECPLEKLKTV